MYVFTNVKNLNSMFTYSSLKVKSNKSKSLTIVPIIEQESNMVSCLSMIIHCYIT